MATMPGRLQQMKLEPCYACRRPTRRRVKLLATESFAHCFWYALERLPLAKQIELGAGPARAKAEIPCPDCGAPSGRPCERNGAPFVCIGRSQ